MTRVKLAFCFNDYLFVCSVLILSFCRTVLLVAVAVANSPLSSFLFFLLSCFFPNNDVNNNNNNTNNEIILLII
jgi:hypothetical protein